MTDIVDATPDTMDAPTIVLPDRADSPVSEVTERFLRAVVAQVPLELIEELHLFSPLRQGTVETGIAVLAARVPVVVPVAPEPELALDASADVVAVADAEAAADIDDTARTEDAEGTEITEDGDISERDAEMVAEAVAEVVADEAGDDEVTAADPTDDGMVVVHDESVVVEASSDDEDVAVIEAVAAPVPMVRHTVYTARYRYVIKGPERGKWEANVKAEAEAPLVTVETVVRGVQRRAGEESEIVRFTQAQIANALRMSLA
ncbi:MAG: hypothetical protein K2R93_03700 [Gemmatimonadaceae bacterium]|nr:hypothetical protein [Gemmatimonadaceae bacterium]